MASEDCGRRINKKAKLDRISNLPDELSNLPDELSNLPDELISQILSLLPTKCAIRTSVLSKKWKYLWKTITSLHYKSTTYDYLGFLNFVKIFRNCNSSNIQKVTMHAPQRRNNDSHVEAWIDEAIKRNVREVDIDFHKLPFSIFSCTTLKVLTLVIHSGCDQDINSFDLPCLKVLYIDMRYNAKSLMEKLISSCPVLEDLTLSGSLGFDTDVNIFMLCAPTLKSLRLQLNGSGIRKISVRAPNLEYLFLSEHFVKYKIKGDFSSLVKANMNIGDIRLSRFHLEKRDLLPYRFTLPLLDHLKCLEMITCHHLFWAMLPKLIRITPSLEVLSIKQLGNNMPPDEYTWVGPKLIPKCVRFHLSTIKIEGFKGRKHELELLSYLIGNSKVSQKLIVNSQGLDCGEEVEFRGELLKISKASKCCHVHLQGGEILDGSNFEICRRD